jgi:hypothetical protein
MAAPENRVSDLSSLTRAQVETLKIHRMVTEGKINTQTALKMRKSSGISRGSHYRVLRQARNNILQSLFTMAAAVQMGILRSDDVQKFLATVSAIPVDGNLERMEEAMALARVIADRIVML